jgi:hypothetical protein
VEEKHDALEALGVDAVLGFFDKNEARWSRMVGERNEEEE